MQERHEGPSREMEMIGEILDDHDDLMWHFVHCCRLLEEASDAIEECQEMI